MKCTQALSLLLVVSTGFGISACSQKGTDGVDSQGSCTQATIDAHNTIFHGEARSKDGTLVYIFDTAENLKSVETACGSFAGLIKGDSCQAMNTAKGTAISVSLATVQARCESVRQLLHPTELPGTPKNEPDLQRNPQRPRRGTLPENSRLSKVDGRQLSEFPKGVSVTFEDERLNSSLQYFVQSGRLIRFLGSLSPRSNYCEVQMIRAQALHVATPMKLDFSVPGEVEFQNVAAGLTVTCVKRLPPARWTVQDVREIFGSLVDLTIPERP